MIDRKHNKSAAVTVAGSGNLSSAFNMENYAGGLLITPAALNATTVIGFKVSATEGGTYVPLCDQQGNLVTITVTLNAAKAYVLPDELFGASYVKVWCCTTAGVDVAQDAARAFTVLLKG